MKLAITIWGNRVSPVFDAAGKLMIADIENRAVIKKTYASFDPKAPSELVKLLKKMQVSVLVCGAISTQPADLIVENDLKLISFVTGHAVNFLEDFARKQTIEKTYMMPGCSKQYGHCYKSKKFDL